MILLRRVAECGRAMRCGLGGEGRAAERVGAPQKLVGARQSPWARGKAGGRRAERVGAWQSGWVRQTPAWTRVSAAGQPMIKAAPAEKWDPYDPLTPTNADTPPARPAAVPTLVMECSVHDEQGLAHRGA